MQFDLDALSFPFFFPLGQVMLGYVSAVTATNTYTRILNHREGMSLALHRATK